MTSARAELLGDLHSNVYDLPALYDELFPPRPELIDSVLGWINDHSNSKPQSVLDPACGTGFWLRKIAPPRAVGVDINRHMIDFARRYSSSSNASFIHGDMRDIDLGGELFDVIICPGATVGHLPGVAALEAHLRHMRAHLAPHGIYCLGCPLTDISQPDPCEWTSDWKFSPTLGAFRVRTKVRRSESENRVYTSLLPETLRDGGSPAPGVTFASYEACEVLHAISRSGMEVVEVYYTDYPGFPSSRALHDLGGTMIILKAAK